MAGSSGIMYENLDLKFIYNIKPLDWTINNTAANRLEFFEIMQLSDGRWQLDWYIFDDSYNENIKPGCVLRFNSIEEAKDKAEKIHQENIKEFLI